jgi:hypothetical protein
LKGLRKGLRRCDVMEGNWRLAVGTRQEGMRGSGREEWEIHFLKGKKGWRSLGSRILSGALRFK